MKIQYWFVGCEHLNQMNNKAFDLILMKSCGATSKDNKNTIPKSKRMSRPTGNLTVTKLCQKEKKKKNKKEIKSSEMKQ